MGSLTVQKLYTLMACALMGLALAGALAMLEAKPAYAATIDVELTYTNGPGEEQSKFKTTSTEKGDWLYHEDAGNPYHLKLKGGTYSYTIKAVNAEGAPIPLPDFITVINEGSTIVDTGEGILGKVICDTSGIIAGGRFLGPVTNGSGMNKQGTISGGKFEGPVDNKDGSTINGGTFNGPVTNRLGSTITDGSVPGSPVFKGPVNNHASTELNESGGTITGGRFLGPVTNGALVPYPDNPSLIIISAGTITGGFFEGRVDNGHGIIEGGTFMGDVSNGYVGWCFSIDPATRQKTLLKGTITGGTFGAGATVDNRRASTIKNVACNGTVINRLGGTVSGVTYGFGAHLEEWVSVRLNNLGTLPNMVDDGEGNTYVPFTGRTGDFTFTLDPNVTGFGGPLRAEDVRFIGWNDKGEESDVSGACTVSGNQVTIPAATFGSVLELMVEAWGVPTSPTIAHGGWVVQPGSANDGDELVALTAEAEGVELYYTTDGTDPRKAASPNELSSSAKRYEGVFAVPRGSTTTIKAVAVKTYDGGVQRIGVPTEQSFTPAVYTLAAEGFPWVKGAEDRADAKLVVTGGAPDRASLAVHIDGALVDAAHYTVGASAGATVITFKPAFLDGLDSVDHIVQVSFADGSASTTFLVAEAVPPTKKLASTGDAATPLAATAAAAFAGALACGGFALALARRRS